MFWGGIITILLGVAVPDDWNQWIQRGLILAGFAGVLYAPARKYRAFKRRLDLQDARIAELKTSKLSVSYDPASQACRTPSTMAPAGGTAANTFEAVFHRLVVRSACIGSVTGCSGRITCIRFGNEVVMDHETLMLTFAPGDKANAATRTNKEIVDKAPEKLDVLFITEHGQIVPCTPDFQFPNAIKLDQLFARRGDYFFTIVVSGSGTASVEAVVKFTWNGDWKNAFLEVISTS